jgi:hypothetical protein
MSPGFCAWGSKGSVTMVMFVSFPSKPRVPDRVAAQLSL